MSTSGLRSLPTDMFITPWQTSGSKASTQTRLLFAVFTELGFLRLLTNTHVMGKDVLPPAKAWRVYDEWRSDDRVIFLPEPAGFSEEWRQLGGQIAGGPNVWTDAYLAAFTLHLNATVITLDRKFLSLGGVTIKSLV